MKFTQSLLVAVAALGIGEVAAKPRFRGGSGGGSGANSSSSIDTASSVATASSAATASVVSSASAAATSSSSNGGGSGTGSSNAASANTCLAADALQTGSASAGGAIAEAGQSNSATDTANFINFCQGQTLTNGLQVQGGSCNGIPMGKIPSTGNMISSVIVFPSGAANEVINANAPFTIKVKTSNLAAGVFTNPATTYYSAPQDLTGGNIIGHTHVTVQDANGGLPSSPLDPGTFSFFKGINTPVDQNGLLTADVTAGLAAGFYRICTMTAAANHQPVTMPIAQRGAQDDCRYFSVGGVGQSSTSGASSSSGSAGSASSSAGSSAATGSSNVASSAVAASGTSSASASTGTGTASSSSRSGSRSGRFGSGRGGRGRFAARAYVA